ncbi:MAG: proP 1 [Candidatus Midichloriaceae bacterium]|jgi:MHS family proline/betaine transporter-like MFS transporter|nr:proP 1 [Candidatus Midichloriaceae bacterium]
MRAILKKNSRILLAVSIGSAMEFYDYAICSFLITEISKAFFPNNDPIIAHISAFTVFFLGFLARPLGGALYGYIGDKISRKKSLEVSLFAMSVLTLTIGCLPTYDKIGIIAPIIISLCRILQGMSVGGEFVGSLILISEKFQDVRHKAFYTSISTSIALSGWFLGMIVVHLCTTFYFTENSWRIPFFIGCLTALAGFYIRRNILEGGILLNSKNKHSHSTFITKNDIKPFFSLIGIGGLMGTLFYGQFVYQNAFLTAIIGIDINFIQKAVALAILIYMMSIPLLGYISDLIGHINMMKIFSALTIFMSYPIFYLISTGYKTSITISFLISAVL